MAGGAGAGEGVGEGTAGVGASAALPPVLHDVRLTFTLPPGSFATMFLREVMKTNDDVAWAAARAGDKEEGEEGEEGLVDAVCVDGN